MGRQYLRRNTKKCQSVYWFMSKNMANHVKFVSTKKYDRRRTIVYLPWGPLPLLHSRRKQQFWISFEGPGSHTVVPQVHKNNTCLFKYLLSTPRNHVNPIFRQNLTSCWSIFSSFRWTYFDRPIAQLALILCRTRPLEQTRETKSYSV